MAEYKLCNADGTTVLKSPGTTIVEGGHGWKKYQDWLAAGGVPDPEYDIEELKIRQKATIKDSFLLAPSQGMTSSLGHKVNSTREDKDNMKELLDYCTRLSIGSITIRLYDNSFASVTTADLITIINEIQEFGLGLYQRKWAKEAAIDAAATEDEITAITWESTE